MTIQFHDIILSRGAGLTRPNLNLHRPAWAEAEALMALRRKICITNKRYGGAVKKNRECEWKNVRNTSYLH
jgi:hypothetical protein